MRRTVLKLPPDMIADTVQRRDELGATGIGNGVSIPHARRRELVVREKRV